MWLAELKLNRNLGFLPPNWPIMLVSGIVYWLIFAFSSGILQYYNNPLIWLFTEGVGSKPVLVFYTVNVHDFLLYSGLYWFPNEHFGISLLILPTFVACLLAVVFGFIVADVMTVYSLKRKRAVLTFTLLPSIATTGACCSVPFMFILVALVSQQAALGLYAILREISYPLDLILAVVLIYIHRSMGKTMVSV